jgi:hypothetical protein
MRESRMKLNGSGGHSCLGGRSDYPKFQSHEKILSRNEVVCRSEKLSGTPKRDHSLFSLLLEIESRLRTTGRNDQIEKDRQRSRANNLSRYCE